MNTTTGETTMTNIAKIGHNNPPDPVDVALAPFNDMLAEAENWLDGGRVEDAGQMAAVDALIKDVKAAIKAAKSGEEAEAKPLHEAWKAAKLHWKPALDDLDRIKNGLTACVDEFKRAAAKAQEEAARLARLEADRKRHAAEMAIKAADASDIEAQRRAAQAQDDARAAQQAAAETAKHHVKGLRTVTRYETTDERAALHWIARNDKEAVRDFVAEYVRRNHKAASIDGVRVWIEKEAF